MPGHDVMLIGFSAGRLEAKAWLAPGLRPDLPPPVWQPASVLWALGKTEHSRRFVERR
jgi:hypothetical protein